MTIVNPCVTLTQLKAVKSIWFLKEHILWSTANREIFAPRYFTIFAKLFPSQMHIVLNSRKIKVHEINIFVGIKKKMPTSNS